MKLIILSCLVATVLGLPAPPEPEPQERGIKEDISNAASNLAQNYNDIKNEVQNQLTNLPQQISDNVVAPIQQAVGPITETQDSYHITFVIPKPQLNWSALSDYLPSFLKPSRYSSGVYGNRFQNGRSLDNYSENAQEPGYIIVFALPNTPSWLQYPSSYYNNAQNPFSNLTPYYNNAQNTEARL